MLKYLVSALFLTPALLLARSASDIVDGFVVPPAFQTVKEANEHGIALISQHVARQWKDPLGIRLTVGVDDTNVISQAFVSSQLASMIEQVKKALPKETLELARVFGVHGHDWILLRLRGADNTRKYLRVVALGENGGLLSQIELFGAEAGANDIGRYLKWILEDNSPEATNANPPAPVTMPGRGAEQTVTPERAVSLAAAAAPEGIDGVFELTVKATGRVNDTVYLNSEADYRDQRNLTIKIPPYVVAIYTNQFGVAPDVALKGKTIRVRGEAHRVTIWFYTNGVRTENYYYQTHVRLIDPRQIEVPPIH